MEKMNLEIWAYIFGGATIFGLIVGVFSVWNGRRTRADLREIIREIGQKLDEGFRRMDEGFRKMDEGFRKMDERTAKISELIAMIPQKTVTLLEDTSENKTKNW